MTAHEPPDDTPPRPSSRSLVDPELLPALDLVSSQDLTAHTLATVRASDRDLAQRLSAEAARFPGVRVDSHYVARARGLERTAGDPAVRVLLCRPTRRARLRSPAQPAVPAVLWVHGGGYVSGSADLDLPAASALAQDLGCAVAVVDYRLAPEHPHPAALHDCYAALAWLSANAGELDVDLARMAVLGESAGGGLAAATCLLARDRRAVALAYQVLVYPMLDDRTVTRAGHPYAGEFVWTRESNRFGWTCYLGSEPGGVDAAPYAVPSRAADLAGLPPTSLCVGSLDLFVDESVDYARRLIEAGVPTELHVYPGAYHGFPPGTSVHKRHHQDVRTALQRAFGQRSRTVAAGL